MESGGCIKALVTRRGTHREALVLLLELVGELLEGRAVKVEDEEGLCTCVCREGKSQRAGLGARASKRCG